MNVSFAHRLNDALDAELARRARLRELDEARDEQSQYGWTDEQGVRQGGLIAFVRYFWPVLEPATPFVDGWPLWAICEHLEAVSRGDARRILMNVPPGFQKSMMVNIWWPAFEWGPLGRGHERYLSFSYSANLTIRDNRRLRDLITSDEYQALYGDRVHLRNDATNLILLEETGWKIASSVGGTATGHRASRILLDDPHSVAEAESETIRTETVRWFREAMSNRLQDLDQDAIVIIMQRVHEYDCSGVILTENLGYDNLCIPMHFDVTRQLDDEGQPRRTTIGWHDPRALLPEPDGVLAWPERFSPGAVEKLKNELGDYAWAGQYEQMPTPRGGGLFKRHWWRILEPGKDGNWPKMDLVIASLDPAYTAKTTNDPSALTVWGVFAEKVEPTVKNGEVDPVTGAIWHSVSASFRRRVVLVGAWRKWLPLHGDPVPKLPSEIPQPGDTALVARQRQLRYAERAKESWGLVELVAHTCRRLHVSKLLVEDKGPGISVVQELARLYRDENFTVQLVDPKSAGASTRSDKLARAHAVVPMFAKGLVFAPHRDFAEMVIQEAEIFPFSAHDDLVDSMTQALRYLRENGLLQTDEEAHWAEAAEMMPRPITRSLYPV